MQKSAAVLPQGLTVTYQDTTSPGQLLQQAVAQALEGSNTQIEEAHSTTNNSGQPPSQEQDSEAVVENDKKAIYRHPLFPLMAMFFEKCEQATQTPDCPSSDCFDVDIQAFVLRQEQEHKAFFSDDPELDGLMVKAIQVLRIHLLELEKVNELCKDFCNRYIACLKGKLQSEQLLRVEGIGSDAGDESDFSPPPPSPAIGTDGMPMTPTAQAGGTTVAAASAGLAQGQIVSGGTVYQMVQTPHGLVAQPIQIPPPVAVQTPQPTTPTMPSIPGSMPLSQIGTPSGSVTSPTTPMSMGAIMVSPSLADDDEESSSKKSKRGILPKLATQVMKSWLFQHIVHPYPTEDEKRQIATQTNLSLLQVNNWFINARRRILQPMLDASNPDGSKAKKPKNQNRPVQRFWPENIATMAQKGQLSKQDSTDEGGDDVTSSPAMSDCEPGMVDPSLQQVLASPQATLALTPQPIMLPPGVTLTADGQLINMSGALVGTLALSNSGMLAGATQLTSMLAAVATNNSLLAAAQATTTNNSLLAAAQATTTNNSLLAAAQATTTNNSLLAAAQAMTAVSNGELSTQPLIVEEQGVESDSR